MRDFEELSGSKSSSSRGKSSALNTNTWEQQHEENERRTTLLENEDYTDLVSLN